ncbi:hypothetical protein K3495_g6502 [Podosphaera aphanis]|nr:hypothetical protein K3495_g6502 [Podosphaera aphanis]
MLEDNLQTYDSHWLNERQRMSYVFRQTKGLAQGYLTQRMKLDHPQAFENLDDMLTWLTSFKDPNEKETARVAYRICRMSSNESFNNFYSRFSELSSKARIDPSDILSDLFHKLSPELFHLSISFMAKNPPLSVALQRFQFYDSKLRLNKPATHLARMNNGKVSDPPSKDNTSVNPRSSDQIRMAVKCYKCLGHGHISTDCPTVANNQQGTSRPIALIEEDEGIRELEASESENDEP